MYAYCMFCNANLGRNETIEAFPVGRRLAFDGSKGRLWVTCRTCERWNLSPLEERWEAIEQCEVAFQRSRLRVCTPNIGLSRLKDGLDLVRVGAPKRPEFAAWRYGDQFGRRRRRTLMLIGSTVGIAGGAASLTLSGLLPGVVLLSLIASSSSLARAIRASAPIRIGLRDGSQVEVTAADVGRARLLARGGKEWCLSIPEPGRVRGRSPLPSERSWVSLEGQEAVEATGRLLARVNVAGGSPRSVRAAVAFLEERGSIHHAFAAATQWKRGLTRLWTGDRSLAALPREVRLALEMSAHESSERQALEGELARLHQAWKEAEEIGAISDSLLVPERVRRALARLLG